MDDFDLLSSFTKKVNENHRKRTGKGKQTLEDDISDITFLLHWFPQFTLDELLDMPLVKYNALLRNAKADRLQDFQQLFVTLRYANATEGDSAKDYFNELSEAIRQLRK